MLFYLRVWGFYISTVTELAGIDVTMLAGKKHRCDECVQKSNMCVHRTILHVFLCVVVTIGHGHIAVDHWVGWDSRGVVSVPGYT